VLVEICLTSNEVILSVEEEEHPFLDYQAAGVPMTLASDDEGISRIDLSNEYWLAAQRYDLGYPELKKLARNSLEYSFLEGDSLWQSPQFTAVTRVCSEDRPGNPTLSPGCASFLAQSDRARLQWQLEGDFAEFENLPWF
jgi:adenosine deaminase/adenosine deaminase CECR1